jgi:hypothetical protein
MTWAIGRILSQDEETIYNHIFGEMSARGASWSEREDRLYEQQARAEWAKWQRAEAVKKVEELLRRERRLAE